MVQYPLILLLSWSLFAASIAEANENRPFWTEQALFHFGEDVFFTGRASCAPNVEEGRQRAYLAAVQEVKNFTRAQEIGGFPLDTQMIFEDSHPADCAPGLVTVWRLLRAPRLALDGLARRGSPGKPADISPILAQVAAVRNLTPRVGMLRDEVWNRYGLPRSIWARPEKGELIWDYAATDRPEPSVQRRYITGPLFAGAPQQQGPSRDRPHGTPPATRRAAGS
ncbi:MAG: hypothetical protein DYH03_20160 [Nitrospira sp. NTP1]|nr:hypothetical protein [Nitrospira sp. NTP1]